MGRLEGVYPVSGAFNTAGQSSNRAVRGIVSRLWGTRLVMVNQVALATAAERLERLERLDSSVPVADEISDAVLTAALCLFLAREGQLVIDKRLEMLLARDRSRAPWAATP